MNVEVTVPSPGESVKEVTLSAWLKEDGDYVETDEELFEIESDKATLSVSSAVSGKLERLVNAGDVVAVGAVACTIDTDAVAPEKVVPTPDKTRADKKIPEKTGTAEAAGEETADGYPAGVASPAARKLMAEQGIHPDQISGSGRGGRITKADVLTFKTDSVVAPPSAPTRTREEAIPPQVAAAATSGRRSERRHKLSQLRLKVAERLVAVKNQTAMLTTFNEADMSAIMETRKQYKELFLETHDVNLGLMSFFVKAVTEALALFPPLNAKIEGDEIVYHDYIDLGVAVSTPKGLVVPVLRNAELMTPAEIEKEIFRLAERARNNQLTIDEMTGGTFTISNGGVFGSLLSTPILNPPQCGILGMHNIVSRPVAVEGQIEIRPMMYLALSYDHRIVDGRESVGFLVKIKQMLEDPVRLLLKV